MIRQIELLWPFGRPALEYVETHLTDHCNMNCRRCSHFSPLSEPQFADLEVFRRGMTNLARLFRTIRIIRLLGGEPLLNKDVVAFMQCARETFPKARIRLVTNGILLEKMSDTFWDACRRNRVEIQMTVYAPMEEKVDRYATLCRQNGVKLAIVRSERFCVWLNGAGDSPKEESFRRCRRWLYCPLLKDGRLYVCATSAYIGIFNRRFRRDIPESEGLTLGKDGMTGKRVLKWLDSSLETCRWCAMEKSEAEWNNRGEAEACDWFSQKK